MTNSIVLIVQTALRRYAIRHSDVLETRLTTIEELRSNTHSSHSYIDIELGALLDPVDQDTIPRWRALIVPMRRRYVAFLVSRIETFLEQPHVVPLPHILEKRLTQPWATGVVVLDDAVVVQLDLRALARSVLTSQPAAIQETPLHPNRSDKD